MKSKAINFVFKKLIFYIIIMALFTSFAFADDFVVRDAFTGEPINGDDNIIIDINSSVSYDKQKDMYIYSVTNPNSSDIKSNVFDGMVVDFPVSIDAGNNIYIDVYRDGKKLSNNNYDNISAHMFLKYSSPYALSTLPSSNNSKNKSTILGSNWEPRPCSSCEII